MDRALEIKFNGESYLASRENTLLYTHYGESAIYDHVYMIPVQGEAQVLGGYVWTDNSAYEALVGFIQTYRLPQRLNSNVVAGNDKIAWQEAHPSGLILPSNIELPKGTYSDLQDLYFTDSFPEDWQ